METHTIWLYQQGIEIAIRTDDILFCESITKPKECTMIHFRDANDNLVKIMSPLNIGRWNILLGDLHFLRVHRGYVVNYQQVERYSRKDGQLYLRKYPNPIPVSKSGKDVLASLIKPFKS